MTGNLDYRWHLREVMASRGMFSTTDLRPLLAERGIDLSPSQVYRLVVERPERLSLRTLMALLDILDCTMTDLIEPVPARGARHTSEAMSGDIGNGAAMSDGRKPEVEGGNAGCGAGQGADAVGETVPPYPVNDQQGDGGDERWQGG
ncbi:DNA-binding transcriptional regulator, XRE family [Micromonospora rhizosphaerae]|uniref:DNA-binding transcriptional regulator, XRE family n=1 Tax=Micromonospora rhizosphaerae TaxID=568872 RepID=A0A1C6SMF9_9ACTN|nr:DNA-binding transcriptional regulator, XRE family [Micromonospora rhizosphaerae]